MQKAGFLTKWLIYKGADQTLGCADNSVPSVVCIYIKQVFFSTLLSCQSYGYISKSDTSELRHGKNCFLHMGKQRCRSAAR